MSSAADDSDPSDAGEEPEEEEQHGWDPDARSTKFLKRFLERWFKLVQNRELSGAWLVWVDKLREEKRTRAKRARQERHRRLLENLRAYPPGQRSEKTLAELESWCVESGVLGAAGDKAARRGLCQRLNLAAKRPGDVLWLQGDVASKYFVLHGGRVQLFRHSAAAERE